MDLEKKNWWLKGKPVSEIEAIVHDIVEFDKFAEEKIFDAEFQESNEPVQVTITDTCPRCGHTETHTWTIVDWSIEL